MRFARIFAISIAVLLLFFVISTPSYAYSPGHGCAQPVPPLIPGSPGPPPATPGIVLINEVLNNPYSTWNCSDPARSFTISTNSWVELYNPQNQPFNLYEARASLDNGSVDFSFHFPFGSEIAAHGYLVVFPEINSFNNTFSNGNTLRLLFGGVTIIDQVSIPTLASDTSYARIPDGSSNWQITNNPTIDTSNLSSIQVAATPTPVATTPSVHSGRGSTGTGSGGYTSSTPVSGKQPNWTKMQLPASDSTATPTSISPLITSPVSSPTVRTWDAPRRIILTALVVALALSLFWCWKLFFSR